MKYKETRMFDLSKFSLQDKVAIVTGGSRGIGKSIAQGFAKAGATVVLVSRKIKDLEATVAEIREDGGKAFPLAAHLGELDSIKATVNTVVEKYGTIDILVNNAGAAPALASVLDADERLWNTIINLNLKGLYFMSQACAKVMVAHGGGKIINVGSVNGFKPEPEANIYSISKAGAQMVTKAFAAELAKMNIQVNSICPGPISTKMLNAHWANLSPEEAEEQSAVLGNATAMGRIGMPDEIVGAAIYLASDASSYTTGAEIVIDGGMLLTSGMAAANQ